VKREIAVLKILDHPNVMKLYDVYETSDYLFLITEYLPNGELFDYIIRRGLISPSEALKFFQMLVHGMDYVHSQHVVHRDLKPENLLLDDKNNLKIADFGFASINEPGSLLETSCGSPHYASPEIVKGESYNGPSSDIWSIGVILFALTSGSLPFQDESIKVLLHKIGQGNYVIPPIVPRRARDLISHILIVDPLQRYTIKDIKEHPYFNENGLGKNYPLYKPLMPTDGEITVVDDDILATMEEMYMENENSIIKELLAPGKNLKKTYYFLNFLFVFPQLLIFH